MIDSDTLKQQRARKRAYSRARYEANRDKILAAKRKREREKALYTAVKATPKVIRLCQLPTCEQPLGTHIQGQPHDYCCWAHYREDFMRAYNVKVVASLPACERRRR